MVTDHLGTPLELYDARGEQTWAAQFDSYGAVRQGRGQAQDCPFRYQGQYEDAETGLYYNRFRYYNPETGQYISQDPIGLAGGPLNIYSYANDPLTWIDPYGLACKPKRPGGHQTGDVTNHGTLSPGDNRAMGHKNARADGFVQSHHPIQNEWAKKMCRAMIETRLPQHYCVPLPVPLTLELVQRNESEGLKVVGEELYRMSSEYHTEKCLMLVCQRSR